MLGIDLENLCSLMLFGVGLLYWHADRREDLECPKASAVCSCAGFSVSADMRAYIPVCGRYGVVLKYVRFSGQIRQEDQRTLRDLASCDKQDKEQPSHRILF